MFFNETQIHNLLRCTACRSTLVAPKLLPCCNATVCSTCADRMRNTRATKTDGTFDFTCSLCACMMQLNRAFVDNLTMQQLLALPANVVSRGKAEKQMQSVLVELSAQANQMDTALLQINEKIAEFCSHIRNQVDIAYEQAVQSIHDYRLQCIAEIDGYQNETVNKYTANCSTSKEMLDFKSLIKKLQAYVLIWTTYLRSNVIDDKKIASSISEGRQLTTKAAEGLRWLNNAAFSNRFLRFDCNPQKIQSDAIGSLAFYLESFFSTQISKVSCIRTFEGNKRLQYGIGFLKSSSPSSSSFAAHQGEPCEADYRNDMLAVGGTDDGYIHIWSIGRNEHIAALKSHTSFVRRTKQVGTHRLLSCSNDGTVKLWDLRSFDCIRTYSGHTGAVWDVQLLPHDEDDLECVRAEHGDGSDKQMFASCSSDKTILVWQLERAECVRAMHGHTADVQFIKLWRNQLISCASNKTVKFWCHKNSVCLKTHVFGCALSWIELLEGDRAAISFESNVIEVWNLSTMQVIPGSAMAGHTAYIQWLKKISGRFLLSASNDQTAKVWNLETFKCIFTLCGHSNFVNFLHVWPKDLFATFSADKVLKIWRIEYNSDAINARFYVLFLLQTHCNFFSILDVFNKL